MTTTIFLEDSFDAAHYLPKVPLQHKCHKLHGHTYHIRIEVTGDIDPDLGWVVDYADVKKEWDKIKFHLDHRDLNKVGGLSNPTCEKIAVWIATWLSERVLGLSKVELRETEHCGVVWTP